MSQALLLRLQRIYAALGEAKSADLSSVQAFFVETERSQSFFVDFSQGRSAAELENVAFAVVANIASIKDHLKTWCAANGKTFGGDQLINSDQNVALVHDLWNTDKHASLNQPPRSGHRPSLQGLKQALQLSTGSEPGSVAGFQFNMTTGQPEFILTGGASRHLVVDARVVNENGQDLGALLGICEAAISAWENELARSGVQLS